MVALRLGAFLAFALLYWTGVGAQEAEPPALRVGVDSDYPPLAYRLEDGRLEGFDVDVAYALCAEMERSCELFSQPFARMIEQLRAGIIDIAVASMSITNERERLVDFSIPYYRAPNRYLGRLEPQPALADGNPEGLTIGVRQGTVFEIFADAVLTETNTVISYPLQEEIFLDLLLGRLDATLGNGLTLQTGFLDTQLGVDFGLIGPDLDAPEFFGRGEAVAMRKGQPDLKAAIDAAIERLRQDGGLREIWHRYFALPADTALAEVTPE